MFRGLQDAHAQSFGRVNTVIPLKTVLLAVINIYISKNYTIEQININETVIRSENTDYFGPECINRVDRRWIWGSVAALCCLVSAVALVRQAGT